MFATPDFTPCPPRASGCSITESLSRRGQTFLGLLDRLVAGTGVDHWVDSVSLDICATGREYYNQHAVAVGHPQKSMSGRSMFFRCGLEQFWPPPSGTGSKRITSGTGLPQTPSRGHLEGTRHFGFAVA